MARVSTLRTSDAALALALTVASLVGLFLTRLPRSREVDLWALGLATVAAAALVGRRSWPVATATVVTSATALYLLLGYPYSPVLVSFFVAVYSLARYRPLRQAVAGGAVALLLLLAHVVLEDASAGLWSALVPRTAWVLIPVAVGVAVRQSVESAERERRELVRRHVDDERMRVSQDVHDIVGHGLAAIKMQADVALHLLERKPEHARVALEAISRSSAAALDELRATLATLRPGQDRRPVAGLARLPELRERMAEAGIDVRVVTDVDPDVLPNDIDLVAYRVVQESLTNVMRHSGSDTVTVTVSRTDDVLEVDVVNRDDPAPHDPAVEGFGIDGMRDRVQGLGGRFEAHRRPEGGFVVRAALPIPAEER